MKRSIILLTAVALLAYLHQASAQVTVPLLDDALAGPGGVAPEATEFEWGGQVARNGSGQLNLSTDTSDQSLKPILG